MPVWHSAPQKVNKQGCEPASGASPSFALWTRSRRALQSSYGARADSRVLREVRQNCVGALRRLKRRWQPLTQHLRQFQTDAIGAVTAKRDIGFTALLVVLLSWADTSLPFGLVRGLPALGFCSVLRSFPAAAGQAHRVGRSAGWLAIPQCANHELYWPRQE